MAKKITDQDGNVYIQKKPVYKRLWFIILAAIVLIVIIQQTSGEKKRMLKLKTLHKKHKKQNMKFLKLI